MRGESDDPWQRRTNLGLSGLYRADPSRCGGVYHDPAEVGDGLAREGYLRRGELTVAGAAGQLQVALEHLGHSVHAPAAQRPAAGQRGQATVGLDAAVLDKAVRLSTGAVPQYLQPHVHQRGETVIDLRKVNFGPAETRMLPKASG